MVNRITRKSKGGNKNTTLKKLGGGPGDGKSFLSGIHKRIIGKKSTDKNKTGEGNTNDASERLAALEDTEKEQARLAFSGDSRVITDATAALQRQQGEVETSFKEAVNDRFDDFNIRLNGIDARVRDFDTRLETLETNIKTLQEPKAEPVSSVVEEEEEEDEEEEKDEGDMDPDSEDTLKWAAEYSAENKAAEKTTDATVEGSTGEEEKAPESTGGKSRRRRRRSKGKSRRKRGRR
tara:strand:+ start:26 stop:733 length:708 start_codon:yes stop_codon:yes gene_type:complete